MLRLKFWFLKFFYKLKYRRQAPEMVRYWMSKDSIEAKLLRQPEGHLVMQMAGEDYPFPHHPRGALLYGPLSSLKHVIKNRVFNDSWQLLEEGKDPTENIRQGLDEAFKIIEDHPYDLVPHHALIPSIKELYRALNVVEEKMGGRVGQFKELLCFILQEDDAYRMRFQWLIKFFWKKPTLKDFDYAISMLEHAEIVGDMKERQRLFRRILMVSLQDHRVRECFSLLVKELNWKKLKLTKADKYFLRAKYFKCDFPEYGY